MSYISGPDHFINYLQKALRESEHVREDQLMAKEFYLSEIWEKDLADNFTWAVKEQGVVMMEEENVLEWLSNQANQKTFTAGFDHILRDEFQRYCEDVADTVGVYSFWSDNDMILYVGRSVRLGQRLPSSFNRFRRSYNRRVFCKTIENITAPDACILELYLINRHNPPYNKTDNYPHEDITVTVDPIPGWGDSIQVNYVENQQ